MATPTTAITRLDLSMSFSEFNAAMNRSKYIGHKVFPPMSVGEESMTFRVMPTEAMMPPIEDTKRAPKAGYKRDNWEWGTDSYKTEEHGVEEITDDRQIKMYGEVNAEAINRDRALQRVAQAYEATCASLAFDTGYFTGDYTVDIDAAADGLLGDPWSTKATADPIGDMDALRQLFIDNCGHAPNALVLEETALLAILRTARVEELTKYTGQLDSLTMRNLVPQLQDLFRLEKIVVAEAAVKNTAGLGVTTPVFARLWDSTKALLCRIYDGPDIEAPEPFLGRTIMWSEEAGPLPGADGDGIGVLVEEYREEQRRGGVIRARTDYTVKRFYKPAGMLLTNVTA